MQHQGTEEGEPFVDARYTVLWETDYAAVLSKSGNLPCHPSGRYRHNTLESLLRRERGYEGVHFVSRLDRETSGCVLVARTKEAAAWYGREMAARRIHKEYLCLVQGVWDAAALAAGAQEPDGRPGAPDGEGWVDVYGWIRAAHDEVVWRYRRFERAAARATWAADTGRETALTQFRALDWRELGLEISGLPGCTLLACRPVTGRTHQIRATLRGLGFAVVGDKLYGPDYAIYARMCENRLTEEDRKALVLDQQALHAWKLRFRPWEGDHPAREPVEITDAPLALLREAVARLRG